MKPLKFRAWIEKKKKIVTVYEIEMDGKGYVNNVTYLEPDGQTPVFHDEFKLMQSSSVEDINENEVYEGDIVQFLSGASAQGQLEYNDVGIIENFKGAFYLHTFKDEWFNFHEYSFNVVPEILGNIFENPELVRNVDE